MIFYTFDHLTLNLTAPPLDELSAQLIEISHM
jgi:hypothetical protein